MLYMKALELACTLLYTKRKIIVSRNCLKSKKYFTYFTCFYLFKKSLKFVKYFEVYSLNLKLLENKHFKFSHYWRNGPCRFRNPITFTISTIVPSAPVNR